MKNILIFILLLIPTALFAQNYHYGDSLSGNKILFHSRVEIGDTLRSDTTNYWPFGDSFTLGDQPTIGNPYSSLALTYLLNQLGYAYQLAQEMGARIPSGFKGGIGGTTAVRISVGDSSLQDRTLNGSLSFGPQTPQDYVSLMYGMNDAINGTITTTSFKAVMLQATDTLVAHGWALSHIIWFTVPYSGSTKNAITAAFNTAIISEAGTLGTLLVDDWTYESTHGGYRNVYGGDSLHNNAIGHTNIVKAAVQVLPLANKAGTAYLTGSLGINQGLTVGSYALWPNSYNNPGWPYNFHSPYADIMVHGNSFGFGPAADSQSLFITYPYYRSIYANTSSALYNVALGFYALGANNQTLTTGNNNVAIGRYAIKVATSANNNVGIGQSAMVACSTCGTSVAIGSGALAGAVSSTFNVAVGYLAGEVATSNNGTYLGEGAGVATSSGASNTFVGQGAAPLNNSGGQNVAVGAASMGANTGSSNSTAVGQNSLHASTGAFNTCVGQGCLFYIVAGTNNTAIGGEAGYQGADNYASINGNYEIMVGSYAVSAGSNKGSWGANVAGGAWTRLGISNPNPTAWVHPSAGRASAGGAPLKFTIGSDFGILATTALSGTGSVMLVTYAAQSYPPFAANDKVFITGTTSTGVTYNGIWVVTLCTTTQVSLTGTGTGSQSVAGTVQSYTLLNTPEAGAWENWLDSAYYTGQSATRYNIAMSNRSNYFTVPQYLDNLSGAPATGYQILVHRTDSAWDEVPVSVIGGGVTTIGSPSTSYANGATISGATLTLGYATGSNPGILSTGTQTIAGAKTFNGNILGSGTTNATFAHFVGNSATPSIAVGAGAGTGPTFSIVGTDQDGSINVTTGTSPSGSSANIVTVTFSAAFPTNTFITLTPTNINDNLLAGSAIPIPNGTTTNFTINASLTALTAATTYSWYYHVGSN